MLTLNEISSWLGKLKEWSLEGNSIAKTFKFNDFKETMTFVNRVGEIAEKMNHHPDIMISYNVIKLNITTHSKEEITEKDFQLAEEIDKIELGDNPAYIS